VSGETLVASLDTAAAACDSMLLWSVALSGGGVPGVSPSSHSAFRTAADAAAPSAS
jgi:hypothetical protein